ncbi:MAG: DNA methyltransferase [Promethearchaeota archaeon]
MKPIDYPIIAHAHDPMHVQHKYWSRKPINVVQAHIKALTQPGDVVLDPFCGSGTTVSQALILGRKVIGTDLNPIALHITTNTVTRVEISRIHEVFERIKENLMGRIQDFYRTRCTRCLNIESTHTICIHWKVHHPIKIVYTCEKCGKRGKKLKKFTKRPDAEDLTLYEKVISQDIKYPYPEIEIPEGMVFNQARKKVRKFHELFTKRNLHALALIYHEIESLPENSRDDSLVKMSFKYAFTSMVHLCSVMTPVRPSRPYSSFWATNSYWIPDKFMESNVWFKFESAINGPQGLISSKRDTSKKIQEKTKFVSDFIQLTKTNAPVALISRQDATLLENFVPPGSVDYIFTDPPYSGSIPYLELSTLWACWLGIAGEMDYKSEILVYKNGGKDLAHYAGKLDIFFQKAFIVLKTGKYMSFTYHNLDSAVRKAILLAPLKAGFELVSITYQPPPRLSPAHTLRPFNSAVGDYIVCLQKPEGGNREIGSPVNLDAGSPASTDEMNETKKELEARELEIASMIEDVLIQRGEPTIFTHIINYLDVHLSTKRWYAYSAAEPRKVLKKFKNTRFKMVQEQIGSRKGFKWWFIKDYLNHVLKKRGLTEIVPLRGRIKKFIKAQWPAFQDLTPEQILQQVVIQFPGSQLPDLRETGSLITRMIGR